MNYQQALRVGRVDLNDQNRGGRTDEAITDLRKHAFFRGIGKSPLSLALDRVKVKRRVAKRWSTRLIREGLPRAARLTGP